MTEDPVGEVCHDQNTRAFPFQRGCGYEETYHLEVALILESPITVSAIIPIMILVFQRQAYRTFDHTCRMRSWVPNDLIHPYADSPLSGHKIFSSMSRSTPSVAKGQRLSYAGPLRLQSGTTCHTCRTYTVGPSDSYRSCVDCKRHECQKPGCMFRIQASDDRYLCGSLVRLHT